MRNYLVDGTSKVGAKWGEVLLEIRRQNGSCCWTSEAKIQGISFISGNPRGSQNPGRLQIQLLRAEKARELLVANRYSRVPGHSRASSAVANRCVFVYLLTAPSPHPAAWRRAELARLEQPLPCFLCFGGCQRSFARPPGGLPFG